MKSIRNPGAPTGHLGNMERTQYDGLVAHSAFERRMLAGKTGFIYSFSESRGTSQAKSHPPSPTQIARNQSGSFVHFVS